MMSRHNNVQLSAYENNINTTARSKSSLMEAFLALEGEARMGLRKTK
jgi:hypothetical protein